MCVCPAGASAFFLLLRYTGARLNEVPALDPFRDISLNRQRWFLAELRLIPTGSPGGSITEALAREIRLALDDGAFRESLGNLFQVDPGHVRRKFYERAQACGFPRSWEGRTVAAPGRWRCCRIICPYRWCKESWDSRLQI